VSILTIKFHKIGASPTLFWHNLRKYLRILNQNLKGVVDLNELKSFIRLAPKLFLVDLNRFKKTSQTYKY